MNLPHMYYCLHSVSGVSNLIEHVTLAHPSSMKLAVRLGPLI